MQLMRIAELAEQVRGVSYKPEDLHKTLNHDSVILLRANNIDDGKINFDDVVYVDRSKVSRNQYLKVGDILVCASSGSKQLVGKAASFDANVECTFGAFCKVVRPNSGFEKYLGIYFQSAAYRNKIAESALGANINNIRNEHIDELIMPVGRSEDNRLIVERIMLLKSIIERRKMQLQKLDELIKARFVEMFGDPDANPMCWPERMLSDMLDVLGGFAFKSDGFNEVDGIPVLRIGNINAGFFKPVNMVFWEEDETLERYTMYPGDLVMSLTGTVGKDDYGNVCILGNDYNKYYLNQRNAKLELKEGMDRHYLSQLLRFEKIKKRLTGISRGVRQANISNRDILGLRVPIPPLELQQQYAAFVSQVYKSKAVVQKALDEAQLLFDSLMQKYFG